MGLPSTLVVSMNDVSFAEPRTKASPMLRADVPRGADRDLVMASEEVLGHSDFVGVLQLSRRGGLALISRDGPLRVFKYISCQADWKKRWARRVGWNPARRAHRMSRALSGAGINVCEVEEFGAVRLPQSPRAVWTISRYVGQGRTLRQLKEELQPGVPRPSHPAVCEMFDAAMSVLRRIHDAGFEHRDYHAGNLLVTPREGNSIEPGNATLQLVDLETVMQRRAGIRRRARDISRFLENFIEPGTRREIVDRAMGQYAPDAPRLAARIAGTRRMSSGLDHRARRKLDRRNDELNGAKNAT